MYIYTTGNKLSKRDKLGIHNYIEKEFLNTLSLLVSASFEIKIEKVNFLKKSRTQTENLKQLVRTEYELKIIPEKTYIQIEFKLEEISKMINGWLKYIQTQNPS